MEDFLDQIQKVKKMGDLGDLVKMIPGASKAIEDAEINDDAFKPVESIIYSMTPEERRNPEILNSSRRSVLPGSGRTVKEINDLIKQFDQMKKMMKNMSNKGKTGRFKD